MFLVARCCARHASYLQAVELNRWTEFLSRKNILAAFEETGKPIEEILRSVANIRHTAVHRLRVSTSVIEQFLLDAEALTTISTILKTSAHTREIIKLRRNIQVSIEESERNKYFLQFRLDETLQRIADQRADLQRSEDSAIDDMIREDQEYQVIAGKIVEESMATFEGSEKSFSTAVDTGRKTQEGGQCTPGIDDSDGDGGSDTDEQPVDGWRLEIGDPGKEQDEII